MDKDLLLEDLSSQTKNDSRPVCNKIQQKSFSILLKYNRFVRCYNTPCNRVDEKQLIFVYESKLFSIFNNILVKKRLLAIFLLALLAPIVNIFLLIYLFTAAYQYFNALKIFRTNQRRVSNPFANMKYDAQKCSQLKKNFCFMKIQFKSLRSQFNFKQNTQLTESQGKSGNKSEWMIYNNEFESYYTDFPRWKVKFLVLMFTGIVEVVGSFVIFFLLFI